MCRLGPRLLPVAALIAILVAMPHGARAQGMAVAGARVKVWVFGNFGFELSPANPQLGITIPPPGAGCVYARNDGTGPPPTTWLNGFGFACGNAQLTIPEAQLTDPTGALFYDTGNVAASAVGLIYPHNFAFALSDGQSAAYSVGAGPVTIQYEYCLVAVANGYGEASASMNFAVQSGVGELFSLSDSVSSNGAYCGSGQYVTTLADDTWVQIDPSGASTASVPEGSSLAMFLPCLLGGAFVMRRRSAGK